ncbi:U2 snRNP component Ist3p [Monosporozyma unispora]
MSQSRNIQKINNAELEAGVLKPELSWHNDYRDQAYIFIGGLNRELTEGDILTVFAQYGVPVDIFLVRDKHTGDSKGFAYLKYEDQRSTVLAVDNLNGVSVAGRKLQVDHVFFEPRDDNNGYREAVREELKKDFIVETETTSNKSVKSKKRRVADVNTGVKITDDLEDPMANF